MRETLGWLFANPFAVIGVGFVFIMFLMIITAATSNPTRRR